MPRTRRTLLALLTTAALTVAGCTSAASSGSPAPSRNPTTQGPVVPSGGPSALPVIVSSELGVGPNRLVMSLLDATGTRPVAAPDTIVEATFTGPGDVEVGPIEHDFVWAIVNEVGLYTAPVEFPTDGAWRAEFRITTSNARTEVVPFEFDVLAETSVLRPGEAAPAIASPTADDVDGDLSQLSTDDDPRPSFYETSIAEAVSAREPFVVAFATPKFCVTQACGPTLEKLKPLADAYPGVTFINVEPYVLEPVEGQLQPVLDAKGQLQAVPSVRAFGLLSEPYVFVVDGNGVIVSSYEAVVSETQLRTDLDALTGAEG